MTKRLLLSSFVAVLAAAMLGASGASADATTLNPTGFTQTLFSSLAAPLDNPTAGTFQVKPQEFDPGKTGLVQAAWLDGTGCPTGATIALSNATGTGIAGYQPYTDPACATGDPKDQHVEGLLLAKTGPSANFAAAGAELNNVKGTVLTELGWDLRKTGGSASPMGSHCGAGSPRWDIQTTTHSYFLGCNSPPATTQLQGDGWLRMGWGGAAPLLAYCVDCTGFPLGAVTGTVVPLQIVFDEGQDVGPDFFGAAFLDNIDVNGTLVGHGATDASSSP